MEIVVIGLNHKTTPLDIRERFSIPREQTAHVAESVQHNPAIGGIVIISTCNRTEIYASTPLGAAKATVALKSLFSAMGGSSFKEDMLYVHTNREAALHLFKVASALDSLILGEGQILYQIKTAYADACEIGSTDFAIDSLFKRAIATGKKVRRDTGIGSSNVSVSYAAANFAEECLGPLCGKNLLLIGAGKISGLTATAMRSRGVASVFIANKYFDQAEALAKKVGGTVVNFSSLAQCLEDTDIVISSTAAPHYVLHHEDVASVMTQRPERPLFCLDLAVPRDIDPQVGVIGAVSLYNVDDLRLSSQNALSLRKSEAEKAESIITHAAQRFWDWLAVAPLLISLRSFGQQVSNRQLQTALDSMPELSPKQAEIITGMAEQMATQMLAPAIRFLTKTATHEKRQQAAAILPHLFGLHDEEPS